MSKRGGFDTGPLSWVKGEIDAAFQRGAESLRAFAAGLESGRADVLSLKAAQAHLHQAHGALQIVGIGGITRVTAELEALLVDMENDPGKAGATGLAAAEQALQALGVYLEELIGGARHQPLKLLPALTALVAARGQGKADAVDLYFPDLSGRPPPRERAGMNLHPDETRQFLVAQRARYMRGLLKFLKNDRSGALEMHQAIATIELAQGTAAQRGFWWVALGFFEALVHQALPQDLDARRVCNRIEQQIRRLAEGSPQVAERLLREALYCVARSQPVAEQLRAVQQAFGLRETIPGEETPASAADAAPDAGGAQALAKMAVELRAIEQVLDAYYRDPTRPQALAAIDASAQLIETSLLALDQARAAAVFADCVARIRQFAAPGYSANVRDFEEVAQTLSGLGFFVEALTKGPADFEAIMRPMGAAAAAVDDTAAPMPTIEAQLQRQFKAVQKRAEEWRRDRADSVLATELQQQLAAIQKDAAIVSDAAIEAAAAAMLGEIEAARPRVAPVPAAAAAAPEPEPATISGDPEVDAELLEVYLEEAGEVLAAIAAKQALLQAGMAAAGSDALVTVRRGFHTLKGSGRMVGLMRLGEAAWAIEQTLNLWLQEDREVSAGLLELIARAHAYFADSVARLGPGGTALPEQELLAQAEAVRRGGEEPAASMPAVPAPLPAEATPVAAFAPEHSDMPAAIAPAAAEPTDEVAEVDIGGQRISRSLFELFSSEARTHMAALKTEFEVLKGHGVITDAMLLAVHTLAGIAGTVHFDNLRVLASAFDRALSVLSVAELSSDEEDLVEQAIVAIEQMVVEALGLAEPTPAPQLLDRLENVAAAAVAQAAPMVREEDEMPLPEEEGAIGRDTGAAVSAAPEIPPDAPRVVPQPSVVELDDPAAARRQQRLSDEFDAQLLPIFLEEANELVPALAESLRNWREAPADKNIAQAAKRLLHTLKGSARMAGAMSVGELSHHMETRIEQSLGFASTPANLFEELDTSMDRMGVLFDKLQPEGGPAVAAARRIAPAPATADAVAMARSHAPQALQRLSMLRVRADLVDRLVNEAGEVAIARGRIEGETRALRAAMMELTDNVARLRSQLREIEIQAESQMQSRIGEAQAVREDFDPLQFDRFTRFQELTRLMAESVNDVQTVQQNLLVAMENTDTALAAQARLNRDLQQDLMRVRMLPLSSVAERLHRVVRQTAKELGKRANLDISGGQVELDRAVLERVTAPLEHMLRNSVAHGIESPEGRAAAGKSPIGGIRIEVSQEGNEVLLALADNGAGLDIERIRERAQTLGLIAGQSAFTDAEITDLIFLPGFSTAESISELSGRGVGMDVVRSEVASLGGRIELSTERGVGTRFRIFLPLTLAVSQAVLVKCAGQSFAVPAVMVEQVEQLNPGQLAAAREARQVEWQGRRYPFRELAALLGMAEQAGDARRAHPVLYLRSGVSAVAVQIDEMTSSSQEIVVKTIGPQLARVPGVSGATVLGSGEVALIINPVQLAQRAEDVPSQQEVPAGAVLAPLVMVVDDSLTVRKITGRLLERQGYRVVTARDGLEALEALAQEIPEVMLVDVEMPRMDGFELTRSVRADARLAAVPIIMISSRTADKHQQYARDIGVDHYLGKPYQEDELLRHVGGFIAAVRSSN